MKKLADKLKSGYWKLTVALIVAWLSMAAHGAGEIREYIAYGQFLENTQSAQLNEFLEEPGIQVSNVREFERMKNHIVQHYAGVEVSNSFVRDEQTMVDCVSIGTQPSLRQTDGSFAQVASPPQLLLQEDEDREALTSGGDNMLTRGEEDAYGNEKYCRQGFIPLRRLRLEEMVQFESLDAFFNKYGELNSRAFPNT